MPDRQTFDSLAKDVHAFAKSRGWWDYPLDQRVPLLLRWIKEEADEALEAYEKTGLMVYDSVDAQGLSKPEGFPIELSDIFMIVGDLALGTGVDVPRNGQNKLAYNRVRQYRRDGAGNLL